MRIGFGLILGLFILIGCKTKQKLVQNGYSNCKNAMVEKSRLQTICDSAALDFKWLKIKAQVNASFGDDNQSFQVQLRIRKDSLIFAKVSKAGFTALKLVATKDTVVLLDKLNKKYFSGNYEELQQLVNVSVPFEFLQNFLLGQPTFLYQNEGYKKVIEPLIAFSSKPFDSELITDSVFHQVQQFTCDSLSLKTVGVFDLKTQKEVWVNYKNKEDINGFVLNKNITLKGMQQNNQLILCDIEIKRVKAFENLDVPLELTNDFEQMEIK